MFGQPQMPYNPQEQIVSCVGCGCLKPLTDTNGGRCIQCYSIFVQNSRPQMSYTAEPMISCVSCGLEKHFVDTNEGRCMKCSTTFQESQRRDRELAELRAQKGNSNNNNTPAPIVINTSASASAKAKAKGGGQPVNHCCHCILTTFTAGLWLPFWCGACCCGCCARPCGC